jgi:DNA repair exonuclease SbcCD nuclease subunit
LIRILHTADLHLDSPLKSLALKDERLRDQVQTATRTALKRLVQYGIDEDIKALLIAGDLFDGKERSAKTAAFLISEMDRLREAGISVFYVKGNHDAENPVAGAFELPANVHVFDGRGEKVQLADEDVWIHGVSFRDKHAPESLLPRYDSPVAGAVNIGLMHTSLSGASGHDPYAPCTVSELLDHGFDYWALGHVHKREVHSSQPWIVMPGMPQGRDIGEAGPKSATLLKVDGSRIVIEEVSVAPVEFRLSRCAVSDVADDDDLRRCIRTHLRSEAAATSSDAAILRLSLVGQTERAWQIRRDADVWEETIKDLAEETGCLWVEQVELDVSVGSEESGTSDAVSELKNIMSELRGEEGFQASAKQELDHLISLLPPDRRQALVPDEAASAKLLENITDQAAISMLALMKGASK